MSYDRNVSPVDWYVASYLLRSAERANPKNNDPEARFLTWENTVLVKADSLDEAYEKAVRIAKLETRPYKNALGVSVKWVFEGISEILPIYEEIADGAEIMWADHGSMKLKNIRKRVKKKTELRQ